MMGAALALSLLATARPNAEFDVRTFGAKGDGTTIDTAAVAATFAAAATASAGGAAVTVRLPGPAVYLVDAPLTFSASNALLAVEADASLRWYWDEQLNFTARWAQRSGHPMTMLTVAPAPQTPSLVNVTLSGGGLLDGQGFMWWPFRYHVREHIDGTHWPPYFVDLKQISGLAVSNLTFLDPPMITMQTCGTNDARFGHLNISASWLTPDEFYNPAHSPRFAEWRHAAPISPSGGVGQSGTCGSPGLTGGRVWADRPHDPRCEPPNTDGIDPGCGSEDVHIHDVFIENGDDSVVMKPGWPQAGQVPPEGCTRDVLVERVTIFRGMGANIGGMSDGCVDNITFKDILLDHPSLEGAEIKSENGKDNASFISNVLYQNITFRDSLNATGFPCVHVTSEYRGDGHGYAGPFFPKISNITFRDVDALGCSDPITVQCNATQPCESIRFERVETGTPFVCANVQCTAANVSSGAAKECCASERPT